MSPIIPCTSAGTFTFPFAVSKAAAPLLVLPAVRRRCEEPSAANDAQYDFDRATKRRSLSQSLDSGRSWSADGAAQKGERASVYKHPMTSTAALHCQMCCRGISSGCRSSLSRKTRSDRSMGYISPVRTQQEKISGSMWTKTLRSTLVSEARYFVGSNHQHSSRPVQGPSHAETLGSTERAATVAPSIVVGSG